MAEPEQKLTVSDIGRIGGEKVREKYGAEYYREIGRKGGATMRRRAQAEDPHFFSRIGKQSKSVKKNSPGYGTTTASEAGKRGGAELKRRYGREHFQTIGQTGGNALNEQHPDFLSQIAGLGGLATSELHKDDNFYVDTGKKGGAATKEKYGTEYYRTIAKLPRKPRRGRDRFPTP